MAFSLNRVTLIGHLGKDAETRFTTTNVSVTSFTFATTHSYKGKDGNWVNETTWHNIVSFSLSDYMKENLKKGRKFYIEGRINKRDYVDKDGVKRYVSEIISERMFPLDAGDGNGSKSQSEDYSVSAGEPDMQVEENDDLPF